MNDWTVALRRVTGGHAYAPNLGRDRDDWRQDALCAQVDPDAHFPDYGGSVREAKRVCSACTVTAECLAFALEHNEINGVWGGLSPKDRRRLRRGAA